MGVQSEQLRPRTESSALLLRRGVRFGSRVVHARRAAAIGSTIVGMPSLRPEHPVHLARVRSRRARWWRRPGIWIPGAVVLTVSGLVVLLLRNLLVTTVWEGSMRFRVVSVGPDFLSVDSIPGTAESADGSAPETEYVHDDIPVVPGGITGERPLGTTSTGRGPWRARALPARLLLLTQATATVIWQIELTVG